MHIRTAQRSLSTQTLEMVPTHCGLGIHSLINPMKRKASHKHAHNPTAS